MKLSSSQLAADLRWSNFIAPVGSMWRHKKGGTYMVRGHVFSTERDQTEIQYYRIAGPGFDLDLDSQINYTRPTREWTRDRFIEAE